MIRIFILTGLIIALSAIMVFADKVPMVDRHIFLPESSAEQKEESPAAPAVMGSALEKEILFTGVLITPKGKQAIITENSRHDKTKQKQIYREGDQIKGMTVKEIGPNYVLIAAKENTVRLNLYKGAKTRPVPAPESQNPATRLPGMNSPGAVIPGMTADANQPGGPKNDSITGEPGINSEQKTPIEAEAPASPFGGNRGGGSVQNDSGNAPAAVNPFADILKKGTERNRGNTPGSLPFNLPTGN